MSDIRIEQWGSDPRLDETNIIYEKVKRLQIPGVSDEVLGRIIANPQTRGEFARDIDAIMSQIPPNPSEISRMELLYIKGYWQEVILKDGSKMSFGEIAKLGTKEQDAIIEGMEWAKNRLRLTRYLAEVANQTEKKIDENIQVANQETIQLRIANVAKLRIFAEKNGWKLSKSDEKYLKTIIEDGKPPIDEAKYILSRAIFA